MAVIAFILVLDLYTFKGLRLLTSRLSNQWLRQFILIGYWIVTAGSVAAVLWLSAYFTEVQDTRDYQTFFTLAGLILLMVVPKLIFICFHLTDDIFYLFSKLFKSSKSKEPETETGNRITRSKFITQVGLGLAAIPFTGMIYGMLQGRFDFRVVRQKISFSNLPPAFSGLRIVQISDSHFGSFFHNYAAVEKGFEMINELRPDLILFTGDIVNNYADEIDGWEPYLSGLTAKYGKYAVLGNHDYGDYVAWPTAEAKEDNLRYLINKMNESGFRMLLNENQVISVGSDEISLIGTENWGHGSFSKYGDLNKAMTGVKQPFKILLSHDPSHWDDQVLQKTDIDLTLSGHTHGMQFGIEVPGIKWSPAQYRYPRWGGLYTEGKQHLYVNRGFGYIGFPGRVGISPEITLIELTQV